MVGMDGWMRRSVWNPDTSFSIHTYMDRVAAGMRGDGMYDCVC